jgi:hypothetical protein
MCAAIGHVRYTSNSYRESGHRQPVMSALPPIADMCIATFHVGFGPHADVRAPFQMLDFSQKKGAYLLF